MKPNHPFPIANRAAFSLIEMMITVALLGFIVVGLTAMFVQTQRAFRGGMAQTDVLEAGRAATDLLARELEMASAANLGYFTNFYITLNNGAVQTLPGGTGVTRQNQLATLFFLAHSNLTWTGIGYVVAPQVDGVGTLYRYETNASGSRVPSLDSFLDFSLNTASSNSYLHRVTDGIVHMRVRTYSYTTNYYTTNSAEIIPYSGAFAGYYNTNQNRKTIFARINSLGQYYSDFTSNAVPAYVELELGVLEYPALKKLQALPATGTARADYLKREQTAGRVHIFRRHIAVRNVDPEAYR